MPTIPLIAFRIYNNYFSFYLIFSCLSIPFADFLTRLYLPCVYPSCVSFLRHGYQKATKKGRKALGRRGCKKCKILGGYQMATRGTFSGEKVPFFHILSPFSQDFWGCKGRCTGLDGPKRLQNPQNRGRKPQNRVKKFKQLGMERADAGVLSLPVCAARRPKTKRRNPK